MLVRIGLWAGFPHIDYSYVHGKRSRVHLGKNCSTMNSVFNVISGNITLGDNTIVGHNSMFLTGTHNFNYGKRISLLEKANLEEVPKTGRDIVIGRGCFIGSGVIIIGPVEIGNNVIVGAGSVVTKSLQSNCFAAGIPAKVIRTMKDNN